MGLNSKVCERFCFEFCTCSDLHKSDDIIFFFTLDAKAKGEGSSFTNFSFALGIILLLSGFIVICGHCYTFFRYQQFKKKAKATGDKDQLDKFVKKRENVKMLYADFQDNNFPQQIFLLVNASRSMFTSLFVVTLFAYPLLQVLIFTGFSLGLLLYLYKYKPFKEPINAAAQYFCEVALLTVNLCMLIMGFMDEARTGTKGNQTALKGLSMTVLIMNITIVIGSAVFMVVSIVKVLYTMYKEKKRLKGEKKNVLSEGAIIKPRSTTKSFENHMLNISENYSLQQQSQGPGQGQGQGEQQQSFNENNHTYEISRTYHHHKDSYVTSSQNYLNDTQYLTVNASPLQVARTQYSSKASSENTIMQDYPSNFKLDEGRYISNLENSPSQKRPKILKKHRPSRRQPPLDMTSEGMNRQYMNNLRKGTLDQEDLPGFSLN